MVDIFRGMAGSNVAVKYNTCTPLPAISLNCRTFGRY
jgi:hypothetical protein